MKHAIIVAHPNPGSLTCTVARTYAAEVEKLGQNAVLRDLYRMDFDPCLKAHEIPASSGYHFDHDVLEERELLRDVDVFAFVYPLWFNAPPAILKGYVDRVFSMGFGYVPAFGGSQPCLENSRLISLTLSGAPDTWVRETGALQALMSLFDRHLAQSCGLQVVDHVHIGGIEDGMRPDAVEDVRETARQAVRRNFSEVLRREPSAAPPRSWLKTRLDHSSAEPVTLAPHNDAETKR